jgi:small GTP-binding protein
LVVNHALNWKVLVGGPGGAGKTTFIYRYLTDEFFPNTKLTVGVEFHLKKLSRLGKQFTLVLWDLGGQERFRNLHPGYCHGARGGMVVFDLSRPATLLELEPWIKMFRDHAPANIPLILIGAKADLLSREHHNNVMESAMMFAERHDMIAFIPTSSKNGDNIENGIFTLVDAILNHRPDMIATNPVKTEYTI